MNRSPRSRSLHRLTLDERQPRRDGGDEKRRLTCRAVEHFDGGKNAPALSIRKNAIIATRSSGVVRRPTVKSTNVA